MPATRADLIARLDGLGIATSTVEHPPLSTVEESRRLRGRIPGAHTKNLFLKCKKDRLWLLVALEEAAIDLKGLHRLIGAKGRVSFGSADLLRAALGVPAGSVTPFSVVNDPENQVTVVLDTALMRHERLNFHPLENTATTTIARDDLVRFLCACGHRPHIVSVSAEAQAMADEAVAKGG